MGDVPLLFAFTAGILSFFSPCVFPLLPAYISYLTGSAIREGKIQSSRILLLQRATGFIVGFSLIFIVMGASASAIGRLFAEYRVLVTQISGILIVIFGLQMAGLLRLRIFMYERRVLNIKGDNRTLGSILLGMAFASGWTPCVGLVLSSILLLAGSSDSVLQGMGLLSIYSLGMGIPFLILSLALTYSLSPAGKLNQHLQRLSVINGVMMIVFGLLIFAGKMQIISAWLSQFTLFNY